MSVLLEIKDGSPWYLSNDIWTVPGDPGGSPGLPIVGTPCFLFARVTNNGTSPIENAIVNFYWANPGAGFDRTTANLIGQAFVSLGPADVQDVLCLTPWDPIFVNGGHECVLAEAFHPSDPLPPTPDFNVPTDRHVAQRNLSVLLAAKRMFKMVFEIHNPGRKEGVFDIVIEKGKPEDIKKLAGHIGKAYNIDKKPGELKNWGFVDVTCPSDDDIKHDAKEIKAVKVQPGKRISKCLVGEVTPGATVIHIVQKKDNKIVGGLAVLVLSD